MSMMNKCAQFHGDTPSGKKLNSISLARSNFRRRPILYTPYRNPTQVNNFRGTYDEFFLEFFCAVFAEDAYLFLLYHGAYRSKWPKTQIKGGGPASIWARLEWSTWVRKTSNKNLWLTIFISCFRFFCSLLLLHLWFSESDLPKQPNFTGSSKTAEFQPQKFIA